MTVGALCDLGVKPSAFEWELAKLEIGDFHLHFDRQQRKNVQGIKFNVHAGAVHTPEQEGPATRVSQPEHVHAHGEAHTHGHEHAHHSHAHGHEHDHDHAHSQGHEHEHGRSYHEIRNLIERSALSSFTQKHALGIFHRIAVAEGKIHGQVPNEVTFHEVGALDSIADIVCACVGIEALGVEKVFVSALHDGHGWIDCAHGRFPIPAPATLEILRGIPLGQLDEPHELITPTGAAIVAEFGSGFGPMPRMRVEKVGYGLGSRDLASRPNVLRLVLGELTGE
jgi:uncharacterized protein (DUF111 family)